MDYILYLTDLIRGLYDKGFYDMRKSKPNKCTHKIRSGQNFCKYDCILKTNFRGLARQQVEKFSVLNTEGVNKLETAKQAQIDAHKLEVQSDFHFEMLKHEDNAKKMVEMGFTDKSFNLSALIQSNGSINDAIGKSTARFPRHATCTYNHIIYVKLQSLRLLFRFYRKEKNSETNE